MPTVWFADRERLILEWNFRGRILPEFLVSLLLVGNTLTVSGQGIFLEKIRSLQQIPRDPPETLPGRYNIFMNKTLLKILAEAERAEDTDQQLAIMKYLSFLAHSMIEDD
jgi:hypothetical protein